MRNKENNNLATVRPDLAKEWHPTKNGSLKPEDVSCGSEKSIWWYLPYNDPKTSKHFDFEWEEPVCNRVRDERHPYLSERAVWSGYDDLTTTYPNLATE